MSKLAKILTVLLIAFSTNNNLYAQENNKFKLKGSFNSSYNTKYLPFGYVNGKGPHEQITLNLNYKNFNCFMWSDYDFGEKKTIERDYGFGYSKKLNDKFSVSGNFFIWEYPNNGLDKSLNVGISYKNKSIHANISYYYIFANQGISSGQVLNLSILKNFNIKKLKITPKLETNILYKTFGGDTGISNIDGSISLDYNLRSNVTISGVIGGQMGFKEKTISKTPINNQLYIGGSIDVLF